MVASWTPEIDDLASKSRSASRASGACGRGTWGVLAGLVGNELIEIGGGKVPARALGAVANHDIFQIAIGGVTVERFDRAAELGSGLGCGLESVGRGVVRLALLAAASP